MSYNASTFSKRHFNITPNGSKVEFGLRGKAWLQIPPAMSM